MADLNTQTLFGTFVLITLILAVAAVGRLLGLGLSEALYLAALVVVGTVSAAYHFVGKRRRRE